MTLKFDWKFDGVELTANINGQDHVIYDVQNISGLKNTMEFLEKEEGIKCLKTERGRTKYDLETLVNILEKSVRLKHTKNIYLCAEYGAPTLKYNLANIGILLANPFKDYEIVNELINHDIPIIATKPVYYQEGLDICLNPIFVTTELIHKLKGELK